MGSAYDARYEYQAPQFHDFTVDETEEDVDAADRWFADRRETNPEALRANVRRYAEESAMTLDDLTTPMDNVHTTSSTAPSSTVPLSRSMPSSNGPRYLMPTGASLAKTYRAPPPPPAPKPPKRAYELTEPQSPKLSTLTRKRAKVASEVAGKAQVSLSNKPASVGVVQSQVTQPRVTQPKPPVFATDMRRRRPLPPSTEERELAEIERGRFKAHGVDERVLTSAGDLGVPKVPKARVTVPQPPKLATDARASLRSSTSKTVEVFRDGETNEERRGLGTALSEVSASRQNQPRTPTAAAIKKAVTCEHSVSLSVPR